MPAVSCNWRSSYISKLCRTTSPGGHFSPPPVPAPRPCHRPRQPSCRRKRSSALAFRSGRSLFWDEGVERVLDILEEKACVNTLFVATFTYGNGIASRQLKGHPLPDHGVQAYDENFHGGNYATPHAQYYKNTHHQQSRHDVWRYAGRGGARIRVPHHELS